MSSTGKTGQDGDQARVKRRESRFALRLLAQWRRLALPAGGERVIVAVSGGADSVALLLMMDELRRSGQLALEISVAHLDHELRGQGGLEDALWVKRLADSLGFDFTLGRGGVRERARRTTDNLEQAARRARYEFLAGVAKESEARLVLTGHTLDDQAETVLLRLLRGSGSEGLSGMEAVRPLHEASDVTLARPLLAWARRVDTESYCRERDMEFRRDSMNEDDGFARVRVRRQLLPLLKTFNPRAVEAIARAADLLREDAAVLKNSAEELLKRASSEGKTAGINSGPSITESLSVDVLKDAPAPVRRRALRLWIAGGRGDLRRLELVHLSGVEKLLAGERGGRRAELPGGSFVEVRRGRLWFHVK
jgi:tRNA(Ile)-lysidine synthase